MHPDTLQGPFSEAVFDVVLKLLNTYSLELRITLLREIEAYQQAHNLKDHFNITGMLDQAITVIAHAVVAMPEIRQNVLIEGLHPVYHEPELAVRREWFNALHEMIQMWAEYSPLPSTKINSRWAELHALVDVLREGSTFQYVNNDRDALKKARAAIYKRNPDTSMSIRGNVLFITKKELDHA